MNGRRGVIRIWRLLLIPALLCSSRLAAQNDPRLVAAVRLAQDGLSDSARAVAGRILAATPAADSLYSEALYTMGLLAATEQDRRFATNPRGSARDHDVPTFERKRIDHSERS